MQEMLQVCTLRRGVRVRHFCVAGVLKRDTSARAQMKHNASVYMYNRFQKIAFYVKEL